MACLLSRHSYVSAQYMQTASEIRGRFPDLPSSLFLIG